MRVPAQALQQRQGRPRAEPDSRADRASSQWRTTEALVCLFGALPPTWTTPYQADQLWQPGGGPIDASETTARYRAMEHPLSFEVLEASRPPTVLFGIHPTEWDAAESQAFRFHPDRYAIIKEDDFQKKVSWLFQRVSDAFASLSATERRERSA